MGISEFSSSFFIDKTKQEKQNKLARAKVSTRDTFHTFATNQQLSNYICIYIDICICLSICIIFIA